MSLDDRTKGIPGGTRPFHLSAIADRGWNVLREDLPLPLLVLKQSALDHNSKTFMAFVKERGMSLAPHGKTTMAPQLFQQQLEDGAWGITAATVNPIHVYRRFGVHRILMANQLVGRQNIRYIAEQVNQDPAFDFYCLVDSASLVEYMRREPRPALEIWSYVQSLPEPGLAILTMGKRDAPYDAGLPTPEKIYRPGEGWRQPAGCSLTALNDQHAYLQLAEETNLRVGDMIACGISHPCTAFDKWQFIPVVDDDYNVIDGIRTFF